MTCDHPISSQTPDDRADTLPRLPSWVTARRGDALENVAFRSGAALGHLHLVQAAGCVPHALWRDRRAIGAAEACVAITGRLERTADLRDEIHLLRSGDRLGPAGVVCRQWRMAVAARISGRSPHQALGRALPALGPERIADWLDPGTPGTGQGGPVAQAAAVVERVLAEAPREETTALILADAVLARACGWDHLVPILGAELPSRALRRSGDDLRAACHRAVIASALEATRMAEDLARRAVRLRTVAPKLRAKGAGEAVALFLTRDALAPTALNGIMSDRAARRLCDRLMTLGVVRELTGRDTFRLYGL